MGIGLSIILVISSIITFIFVMRLIRKSSVRIEDTFFWIIFSFILVILSIFPDIAFYFSDNLGFQSPVNLVFLVIIFILLINQFLMSLKISRLTIKQKELVQSLAINTKQMKDNIKENPSKD